MNQIYLTNLKKINIYALLCGLRFSLPIIFFDLKERGFSYSQIGLFFAVQGISALIFEIPAGTFADRFGSKWSLAASSLAFSLTYTLIATESNFYSMLFFFSIWGFAKAFHSGADTAFIIDSLKKMNNEIQSSKYLGQKWSMFYLGLAISSLLSPLFVRELGFAWTYYSTTVATLIATVIILTTSPLDIDHSNNNSIKSVRTLKEYFKYIRTGYLFIKSHHLIKYLLILAVTYSLGAQIFFQYVQRILESMEIDKVSFGYYYAVFTGLAALSSKLAYKIDNIFGKKRMILFLTLVNILSLCSQGFLFSTPLAIISVIAMQLQIGLSIALMNHYLNEHIDSYHRATLNSFKSFLHGLLMFILSPLVGLIADKALVPNALVVFGIILFLISIGPILKICSRVNRTQLNELEV